MKTNKSHKAFYHIYTKGLEDNLLFKDREDFRVGMNYVATCQFVCKICILAFTLMSNHFHFVIYGTKEEAEKFVNLYKQVIGQYAQSRYGTMKIFREDLTSIKRIRLKNEGLKIIIAYVLNNPVKAGINCFVQNYEWGSGRYYFSSQDMGLDYIPVGKLGVREQKKLLHSHVRLPDSYLICKSGYINPCSYLNIKYVEKLFSRAGSLAYFLSRSSMMTKKDGPVTYSDTLIANVIGEILEKKFGSADLTELSKEAKGKLIADLRMQFKCSAKQLARLTKSSVAEIVDIISGA